MQPIPTVTDVARSVVAYVFATQVSCAMFLKKGGINKKHFGLQYNIQYKNL